jgi:TRAP-type C4-dicarboxylate transport system substrate-binding protein
MKNEVVGDQSLVWWDKEWALKDKTRISQKKSIPAEDMESWINKIMEKGIEVRQWYLKTDVVMRIKSLILQDDRWNDLKDLGKRIVIIRLECGDTQGSQIIQKAIKEAEVELAKDGMTYKEIKAKLEKLIKQIGEIPVF